MGKISCFCFKTWYLLFMTLFINFMTLCMFSMLFFNDIVLAIRSAPRSCYLVIIP